MNALLSLLLLAPALARDPVPSASPEAAWGEVRQERIPALAARGAAARARLADLEALRAGELGLDAALPHLAGRRLDDPVVLAGLRLELDARALARAEERATPTPELGGPERTAQLQEALDAALRAEAEADAAVREVLVALEAWLVRHPELAREALAPRRARLRAQVEAARALPADAPERPAALTAAALADEELDRWERLVRSLQEAALQGRPAPLPEADIARLGAGETGLAAREAAARLLAGRGLWAEPEAVDTVLLSWLEEARIPALRAAATEEITVPVEPAALRLRLQAVEAELALPGGEEGDEGVEDPVLQAVATLDGLRREALLAERAALQAGLDAIAEAGEASAEQARRSEQTAEATRQLAEEARASATDAAQHRWAEVLVDVAEATERAAEAWRVTNAREETLTTAAAERAEVLAAARGDSLRLETEEVFVEDAPEPDARFAELRTLVESARTNLVGQTRQIRQTVEARDLALATLASESSRLASEREALAAVDGASVRQARAAQLDQWAQALADERAALDARLSLEQEAGEDIVQDLRAGQLLRQRLRPWASSAAVQQDLDYFAHDLRQELALLPSRLQLRATERMDQLRALPARLSSWNLVKAFLWASSGALVVILGWWIARRRTPVWTEALLERLVALRPGVRREDLAGARAPTQRALETGLDLLVGLLLIQLVRDGVPELAVALGVYLHVAAYRFVLALWELGFAKAPSVRPSLRTLPAPTWTALRRTVKVLTLWWVLRALVLSFLPDVLGLFALAEVARSLFGLVLVGLVLRELARWEPTLRAMVARRQQDSPLVRWLSSEPRPSLLAPVKGAAGVAFLLAALVSNLVTRLSQDGTGLARVFTQVGRMRLGREAAEEAAEVLPAEVIRAIRQAPLSEESAASRQALVDRGLAEWRAWRAQPRRGLLMVVGDRGDGKAAVVRAIVDAIRHEAAQDPSAPSEVEEGTFVRRPVVDRLGSSDQAARWLSQVAGLPPDGAQTLDDLAVALRALPSRVFVLDELNLAFVRAVDGFAGLQAVLYVMNATGDHHFWITSSHRPAWFYLTRLGGLVNTGVFRAVIDLPALTEPELRRLCVGRTRAAGFEVDFAGLVRPNLLGDDPAVELERATSLFFRLLNEATGGNPSVAMRFWLQCLKPPAEADGPLRVWTAPCLKGEAAEGLSNNDLFVLAALRTQDHLDEEELAAVTDLPLSVVRTVVRDLTGRGFVVPTERGFEVERGSLPPVTRALRRRNFIQWGV